MAGDANERWEEEERRHEQIITAIHVTGGIVILHTAAIALIFAFLA